jgi:hypothetical protein
MNALTNKRRP